MAIRTHNPTRVRPDLRESVLAVVTIPHVCGQGGYLVCVRKRQLAAARVIEPVRSLVHRKAVKTGDLRKTPPSKHLDAPRHNVSRPNTGSPGTLRNAAWRSRGRQHRCCRILPFGSLWDTINFTTTNVVGPTVQIRRTTPPYPMDVGGATPTLAWPRIRWI